MCTQYFHHIYSPTPFLHILPNVHCINPPDRSCSALLFPDSVKKKKLHFCLR
jgi:hypothetical protein